MFIIPSKYLQPTNTDTKNSSARFNSSAVGKVLRDTLSPESENTLGAGEGGFSLSLQRRSSKSESRYVYIHTFAQFCSEWHLQDWLPPFMKSFFEIGSSSSSPAQPWQNPV